MGISTETRNAEEFMLAINDIVYLPTEVKEKLFVMAKEILENDIMPRDVDDWIGRNLGMMGYKECEIVEYKENGHKEERYVAWTPRTYKIVKT